jgi:hypothetical protein
MDVLVLGHCWLLLLLLLGVQRLPWWLSGAQGPVLPLKSSQHLTELRPVCC